jgi:hypothetical protein
MPAWGALLAQVLYHIAAALVWKVLAALGIGFITYQGVDLLISTGEERIFELIGSMGPQTQALYGVLRIGTCIKIVFVALAMRATIWGMTDGNIRRMTAAQ